MGFLYSALRRTSGAEMVRRSLTEEVVALHDPVGGVVVAGADDAGPGHVGARGGGGRGAVLLPGREGTNVVVVLVVAPGGVGDDGVRSCFQAGREPTSWLSWSLPQVVWGMTGTNSFWNILLF